jgi:hypothetical protein
MSIGGRFFRYDFFPEKRRLHARYIGQWSEIIAHEALNAFRIALESAAEGGQSFTLLDDFREWAVQPLPVAEIANGFETICGGFTIGRNAMIIPDALVRRQVRRTVTEFRRCQIFQGYEEADRWLAEAERGRDR